MVKKDDRVSIQIAVSPCRDFANALIATVIGSTIERCNVIEDW